MSILARLAFLGGAAALTALIVLAMPSGEASAAIDFLTATPWGRVTGIDLYLGFLIAGAVMIGYERNALGVILAVITLGLGNVIPALWLAWRWPDLMARLAPRPAG